MRRPLGFTMMEVLIVLVIIGFLAATVAPMLYQRIRPAKKTIAKVQINLFLTALDSYFIDTGTFPTHKQGLKALRSRPNGVKDWKGPYLKKEIPLDPWNNLYVYRSPGRNGEYEIYSLGADGREGGGENGADIVSWSSK